MAVTPVSNIGNQTTTISGSSKSYSSSSKTSRSDTTPIKDEAIISLAARKLASTLSKHSFYEIISYDSTDE